MKLCPKCQKQFSDDANFCPVDAARLVPLEAQSGGADSLTSRFELGQRLGGSRTGAVYKATDKTTGKPCVVKLVAPAVIALPGVSQRLERELKQLERVKSAGVTQVLASGKRQNAAAGGEETWIATEWLEGAQTLAEAVGARGPIPAEQAAELIEVVGEALIEAAQVGVVHRDLAPKNILFAQASDSGGSIKIINFSLPVPSTDKIPGVPEFVAPEQVEGRPVDQRSNLYSLGALYYYVLTGQTLFAGSPEEVHKLHQNGQIKPPSQLVAVPAPVEAVIMRALDRSPTKRFLTVRQFVDEVTRVGHGEVIELKQTMAMGKSGRPKGDLVQTLLGVRGSFPMASQTPTMPVGQSPVQAIASAAMPGPQPTIQAGPATMQSGPPAMPPPAGQGMAASIASPPVAMAPLTPPSGVEPQRSPWAPPGGAPAPAPAPAPPVVAAPVVAPQAAQPTAAGKKRGAADDGKGKFRETMWFKKGDLDAQAAVAAAEERARTGKDVVADKADSKAIDERYTDDGSITRSDKEKYSLRTGGTQMMSAIQDPKHKASQSLTKVSEDELVGEMKGLPLWIKLAIPAGFLAIVLIIWFFFRG